MFGAVRKLFIPKPPAAVTDTYIALVAAARNPFFFTALGVPDSIDGRFGMIVVHLFLLQDRLIAQGTPTTSPESASFAQFLSEAFINDMDRSIREFGVGDTGVGHRIKKMGRAYHGSMQAYATAMNEPQALRAALARNLYGTVQEGDVTVLNRMAQYITTMNAALAATESSVILAGDYRWPDAATLGI